MFCGVTFFCSPRMLGVLMLCVVTGIAAQAGLYQHYIIDRSDGGSIFKVPYYAYIISNIPELDVMRPMCRTVLMRRHKNTPHVLYIPLAQVGTYGRKKTELLPYDHLKNTETVVVIDRSRLTDAEKTALGKLQLYVFPLMAPLPQSGCVRTWVQTTGAEEYQVYVELPEVSWIEQAANDLWALPSTAPVSVQQTLDIVHKVCRTAMLSNDAQARNALLAVIKYSRVQSFTLDDYEKFAGLRDVDQKLIALNWNGEEECTAEMAVRILPPSLRAPCHLQTPDRVGLTGWQRFCRTAVARHEKGEEDTWAICAPTAQFLNELVTKVIARNFEGGPYDIPVYDLSYITSLAVGTSLGVGDPDRERLLPGPVQMQMEEVAGTAFRMKVRSMVSTQNWGRVLDEALGKNADTDDPLRKPDTIRRVNQASNTDAVLLLMVRKLSPQVTYTFPRNRITEPYPAFTEKEPDKPNKPDADRRKSPFGPHVYPGEAHKDRVNSREYQEDLAKYTYIELPKWERAREKWEQNRREWERGKSSYQVNYEFEVVTTPAMSLGGQLKLLDMYATQNVLWSTDVNLASNGERKQILTIPVQVTGEDTDPPQPRAMNNYSNKYTWSDCSATVGSDTVYGMGQSLLVRSLRDGVAELVKTALWYTDLKPWSRPGKTSRGTPYE